MSVATNCCRCSSSIGEKAKVQPQNVDGEILCPRCFTWWRANQRSEQGTHEQPRFNAAQMCVAKCQFCEWTMVSFGAQPGLRLRCSHCGSAGAVPLPLTKDLFTKEEQEAIVEAQRSTLKEVGIKLK